MTSKTPNPYKSPHYQGGSDRFAKARKKLFIATFCLAILGIYCTVVGITIGIHWNGGRGDELKSTLHPFLPLMMAIYVVMSIAIVVSLFGLINKKAWAINLGIVSLAISGISLLFPIAGIGIWALTYSRMRAYINHENAG